MEVGSRATLFLRATRLQLPDPDEPPRQTLGPEHPGDFLAKPVVDSLEVIARR
jgi:hypothetical protein